MPDADPAFLAGMAFFAAGHVCYLVLFGRAPPTGRSPASVYAAVLVALPRPTCGPDSPPACGSR